MEYISDVKCHIIPSSADTAFIRAAFYRKGPFQRKSERQDMQQMFNEKIVEVYIY